MHLLVLRVVSQYPLVRLYDYLYRHFIKPMSLPTFLVVTVCLLVAYFTGSQSSLHFAKLLLLMFCM